MSDELKQHFGTHVTVERGHSGIYDVMLDGRNIFSKHELGRFPEDGEIVEIIEELRAR